jgi:hypothetical protein
VAGEKNKLKIKIRRLTNGQKGQKECEEAQAEKRKEKIKIRIFY